jgi:hypothetical protein
LKDTSKERIKSPVRNVETLRTIRRVSYWLLIATGLYFVPKSYQQWKETEEKLDQISKGVEVEGFDTEKRLKITEDKIEEWLKETALKTTSKTFSPPSSNREFWEKLDKPEKMNPQDLYAISEPEPLVVIHEGTKQECYYNTGEWIPEIEKALKQLLVEPWGNKDKHGREFVDLFSTIKARDISQCISMLEDKLSPGLVLSTKKEIRRRILDPYRKELKRAQISPGYFGGSPCPWLGSRESNWIAVCVANIIYCSMVADDTAEQANLIAQSKEPIEEYLKTFEDDGSIPSGIRYWDFGFQHLLFLAELLDYRTSGNVNLFENPKLAKMVTYPFYTLIGKNLNQDLEFYPIFADNKNPTQTSDWVWEVIRQRFNVPENHILIESRKTFANETVGGVLDLLAYKETYPTEAKINTNITLGNTHYYPNMGVLISRFDGGNQVVAIAGGNNGTEHNHNDLGSYTYFSKDTSNYWLPMFGDMGDVQYNDTNFTAEERYRVHLLSSYGHPVPLVDNQPQFTSKKARSIVLNHNLSEEKDTVTYDLLHAYDVPVLTALTREAVVIKSGETGLLITDKFSSVSPINFESPIIGAVAPTEPTIDTRLDTLSFELNKENEIFKVTVFNASNIKTEVKQLETENFDYSQITRIKTAPYRIALSLKQPQTKGEISYKLQKVNEKNKPIESKAIPPRKDA